MPRRRPKAVMPPFEDVGMVEGQVSELVLLRIITTIVAIKARDGRPTTHERVYRDLVDVATRDEGVRREGMPKDRGMKISLLLAIACNTLADSPKFRGMSVPEIYLWFEAPVVAVAKAYRPEAMN